ncbi:MULTISPECIES: preprotein translocase subunit SecG [Hymenobacter]|uniref:Protein-export membrane protein SecG n=2 Tax=Hymenobacter TaxID=89966 RepID=A0ABS6WYA5_9BACT|nr:MULTISPECIES: preprotein translocase subunit SecG [Hymenobacter]MBO3270817.1 preprotein translocase subunit SecG [Hymenobacter defluvii]MBW3128577.1 preprotein translocase subunit SecG [Hymenobacter profundi]QNE39538.1 preprotein translocase subunit SecG [Hymenobacter sp. NBH84]
MYYALLVLVFIVCLLLALVVLAQNPKGGGLSSQFGAGGTAQLMGVKRTGDLLEKLTWGFAIALMVLSLGSHMLASGGGNGPVRSINQQRALETPTLPSAPAIPGTGATPAPAGAPAQQPAAPAPVTPAPAPAAE